jgi:hypothetical protein
MYLLIPIVHRTSELGKHPFDAEYDDRLRLVLGSNLVYCLNLLQPVGFERECIMSNFTTIDVN